MRSTRPSGRRSRPRPRRCCPASRCRRGRSRLRHRPLTESDARAIAAWRYEGAFAAYDLAPSEETIARLASPEARYFALVDDAGALVGHFCVGPHARVAGGAYDDAALDLGVGFRPDLVGCGSGRERVLAVLGLVRERWGPVRVRATIATWNKRALRVAASAGFRQVGSFGGFRRGASGSYVVLLAEPEAGTD